MTGVPGLGKLIDDYDGEPRTLRWLSVNPDGQVEDRESDNRIGWSVEHQMWVQWRLVRDVYRVVDPTSHGDRLTAAELIHTRHGVAVLARRDTEPINPTAARMLAALGIDREARHGGVAGRGAPRHRAARRPGPGPTRHAASAGRGRGQRDRERDFE